MPANHATQSLHDFLGSAQIFTSAVRDLLEEQLRDAGGLEVTLSQLKLLKMVALTEDYTVSTVAAMLGVSNAAASKAVDRLVRRRLLRRAEAEADRRAVKLSLTEDGRRLIAEYDAASNRALAELFGQFPPQRLQETAELLDRLSVSIANRSDWPDQVCLRCGIHFRENCLLRQAVGRNCYLHQAEHGTNGASQGKRSGGRRSS